MKGGCEFWFEETWENIVCTILEKQLRLDEKKTLSAKNSLRSATATPRAATRT